MMNLRNKIALITGASSGIGAEIAKSLAARGVHVVLVARRKEALEAVATEIEKLGGKATVFPADLSDSKEVDRMADAVSHDPGWPDILVNSAGAGRWLSIQETQPQEAVDMMAIPYFAMFWTTRAFMQKMIERREGHIVNLVSPSYWVGLVGATGYSAARWAVAAFDQSLGEELRNTGVGVSLICPGATDTPYFDTNVGAEDRIPWIVKLYPILKPQQVAEATVRAIEKGQRRVFLPFLIKLTYWAWRLCPWPVEFLLQRTGWKPSRLS